MLIISEDRYHEALKILALKIRRRGVVITHMKKGDMLNHEHVARHIRSYLSQHRNISKVLVCRDSECTPVDKSKTACSGVQRTLSSQLSVPVDYIVVDHSIEGWLMRDAEAVAEVVGIAVPARKLTEDCRPADKLRRLFQQYGKTFDKSRHNRQLAEVANVSTIRERSATFQEFCEGIGRP